MSGSKKYKEKRVNLFYIHLMEFNETEFRFFRYVKDGVVKDEGWLKYADYGTPKSYTDPKNEETYTIHYNDGELKIDKNVIDVDLVLSINRDKKVDKGEIIGYTGSTGNSYQGKKANHLHFGLSLDGKPQLPYEVLKEYINLDQSGVETSKKQDGVTSSEKW